MPARIGGALPLLGPEEAARLCTDLRRRGLRTTLGYFQADDAAPEAIVAAYRAAAARAPSDACLSVKAPPLGFAPHHIEMIAATGMPVTLDSHAPKDADATLDALRALLPQYPRSGVVLPARWRRSAGDAAWLRDTTARIRLVKGEWPDPAGAGPDAGESFLALARALAGRAAPVAVATHDPALAERALLALTDAGTPCELEQLRGMPRRRSTAAAHRLGVPVRLYLPFGPGWWPYAIDKALARPYLPLWLLRDRLGWADPASVASS